MRLVHLARASAQRAIEKGGLKGTKTTVATAPETHVVLARAVYAMPVVADFWTTFQWLRELRRGHDERLVAVYFRVPDKEAVYFGRYNEPHMTRTAAAAAAWVRENPAGAQVVVPRSIAAKDVVAVRPVKQLVGWVEVPGRSNKFACVCSACLPHGDRHLMRRVRGAFAAGLADARRASSDVEVLAALGTLELPLERGRDRLDHTKLVGFSRSPSPQVRRAAAWLLGYFRFNTVQSALRSLLDDPHLDVRQAAVEALVRAGGAARTSKLVATSDGAAISHLVELLEYESDDLVALETLERFADHPDSNVQAAVQRVAVALQPDFKASGSASRRLQALATGTHFSRASNRTCPEAPIECLGSTPDGATCRSSALELGTSTAPLSCPTFTGWRSSAVGI